MIRVERLITAAIVIAFFGSWEAAARLDLISKLFFPAPTIVAKTLVDGLASGRLVTDLVATATRLGFGLLLGCIPAILLGYVIGWSKRMALIIDPLIAAIHPIPKIAVLPLLMILLGIGEASKLAAVAFSCFFPMVITVAAGVRQVSASMFDVVRSYGGSRIQIVRHVILPGSLPFLLAGLRIAVNVGLVVTIAVELAASRTGLGALIWLSWETLRVVDLYAGLVLIAAVGIGSASLIQWLTRRLVPWQSAL
ncbi:MAG TPA: ABC transporter permease [Thermoanaerobaculia bacterium]|nr:ABC transporter permease [Thermoanaerobaculia bacterium]